MFCSTSSSARKIVPPCLGASLRPAPHAYLATIARNVGCGRSREATGPLPRTRLARTSHGRRDRRTGVSQGCHPQLYAAQRLWHGAIPEHEYRRHGDGCYLVFVFPA